MVWSDQTIQPHGKYIYKHAQLEWNQLINIPTKDNITAFVAVAIVFFCFPLTL